MASCGVGLRCAVPDEPQAAINTGTESIVAVKRRGTCIRASSRDAPARTGVTVPQSATRKRPAYSRVTPSQATARETWSTLHRPVQVTAAGFAQGG